MRAARRGGLRRTAKPRVEQVSYVASAASQPVQTGVKPAGAARHPGLLATRRVRSSVLAATLASNMLALALPLVLLQAYDRIIPNQAGSTLTALIIGLIVALLLDGAVRIVRASVMAWATAQYEYRSNCLVAERMLGAPIDAFEASPVGRRLERFTAVDTVREYYGGQAAQNIVDLPFMLIFLGLIALIGGHLVIVPLVVAALCGAGIFVLGKRLNASLDSRATIDDRRYSFVVEVLNGIETVKALALETLMVRRYERLLANSSSKSSDIAYYGAMTQGLGSIGANAAMIGLACLGALSVIAGDMTTGALGACTLLAGRSIQPLTRSVAIWTQLQSIRLAKARLGEALALPDEGAAGLGADAASPGDRPGVHGDISIKGLVFGFGHGKALLRDLSLEVKAGDFVAISGKSGVGKSTLLHLMMGMGELREGEIRFDGVPLAELGVSAVRASISFLPQQPMLFRGTLRDNLVQFADDAVEARALDLANRLGLNEVIARLPDGLETWIGDDMSYALPAGVRQKIAIIRALATDAPIILFDEANSNFDQEGDQHLTALLDQLRGAKTIVMVSHRPSLLRMADRHYQIDDGCLVEKQAERKP